MPTRDPGPSVKDPEQHEEGRSDMTKDELIDALRNH
jgi:hypothetical protein